MAASDQAVVRPLHSEATNHRADRLWAEWAAADEQPLAAGLGRPEQGSPPRALGHEKFTPPHFKMTVIETRVTYIPASVFFIIFLFFFIIRSARSKNDLKIKIPRKSEAGIRFALIVLIVWPFTAQVWTARRSPKRVCRLYSSG